MGTPPNVSETEFRSPALKERTDSGKGREESSPRWRPSRTLEQGAPTRAWLTDPGGHPRAGRINEGGTRQPPERTWIRGADESPPEHCWSHVNPVAGLQQHKGSARRSGAQVQLRGQVRRGLRRLEVSEPRDIGDTVGTRRWSGPLGHLAARGSTPLPPSPTLPIKQQTEPELHASARADPAVSRIGEIKQKRGDFLPPSPLPPPWVASATQTMHPPPKRGTTLARTSSAFSCRPPHTAPPPYLQIEARS
ncbi:hypothetical protein NDU88_002619 [Pleurodeles waltl]|uniref:Uncharacterized protein n=1 Tax=Pleurodeles waltl TaxID=8319 RepID=A0AAV7TMA8_PLEWA|nr:hypothetical protein NDU88_002619 [Pleurodeles waltl]